MNESINVWIIHSKRMVQVTNEPGVPMAVMGYVSEEAKQSAEARGQATVSEIGFNKDDHRSFSSWDEAMQYGSEKAKELGYEYDVYDPWMDTGIDDDYDDWDDDEDYW